MVDSAIIKIKAGNGGDGRSSLRHMKYIEKGGPDGGDGGNGGSVYLVADNNLGTLMDFRSRIKFEGEDGDGGGANNMTGHSGADLYIKIPVGTLVYELPCDFNIADGRYRRNASSSPTIEKEQKEGGILIADFTKGGQTLLIGRGGLGGKGNFRFRSSTNRTPTQFTRGTAGDEKVLRLDMKLIADVGLVGAPNAGKSTLINHLTNAHAKIGNYPFTTLEPNLGVCKLKDGRSIVLADIPGLIEGASSGRGLGDEFLRHIERTRFLVFLIDPYTETGDFVDVAVVAYKMLLKELEAFGHDLSKKDRVVVINKLDITEVKEDFTNLMKAFKKLKVEVIGISAVSGEGLEDLKELLRKKLPVIVASEEDLQTTQLPVKMYNVANLPNRRVVFGNVAEL